MLCAQVFVDSTSISFDKPYTYHIPFDLESRIKVGHRVIVPFGRKNGKRQGVVVSVGTPEAENIALIKPIISIIDEQPIATDEMLRLAEYISERTFCSFYDALRPQLPIGKSVTIVASYTANPKYKDVQMDEGEQRIYERLLASKNPVRRESLIKSEEPSRQGELIDQMVQKGYLKRLDDAVRRVGDASVKMLRLTADEDNESIAERLKSDRQQSVFEYLSDIGTASVKEVCYFTGASQSVISTMIKNGVVASYENEVYRSPYTYDKQGERTEITLTDEQSAAYTGLSQLAADTDRGAAALLYGVTGSGKTQVYLRLIDDAIDKGDGVIVMVPEIALTPQTVGIFQRRYGNSVAVFHSAMSIGQRTDEYKRVKNGDASIAIGTRSAVFAPFARLGLIIMDEEQEHTYKSESTPRYDAKNVAKFRCNYHKCLFVMASATPSVETFSLAKCGKLPLFTLKNRYGNAHLPQVKTINMRELYAQGRFDAISDELVENITQTLKNGRQAILLLNRRGYHTFVSCRSCGNVQSCPNCSISLTYHSANNRLMCHYCGYSQPFSESCPVCSEKQIKLSGYGTQKAQEELQTLFPDARILRMDADTTMTRFSHEKYLTAFANGEYDIMIGTQMVAKGLDFPNVTLVGVINADQSLYSGDFRSAEKTFSLLTQVVGRSGRGKNEGSAIIQTISPESEIIWQSAKQDYDDFYATEILSRKFLTYPPYCDLIVIGVTGAERSDVEQASKRLMNEIKSRLAGEYSDQKAILLGPTVCNVPKIGNRYRYRLILKCKNNRRIRRLVLEVLRGSGRYINSKYLSVFADVNPESML